MKLKVGDKVAIISPSSLIAAEFPWVFELGLKRLRDVFKLEPVLMPNCLNPKARYQDKAEDLHKAFSDKTMKAVIACIGGIDQIQLISYLDANVFKQNPKLFFGYSDNTNLCNFLNSLGIQSCYGGSILTQFAMQNSMYEESIRSLKWAFFDQNEYELKSPKFFVDEDLSWADESLLNKFRTQEVSDGYIFHGKGIAEGILWGGCLESLSDIFRIHERIPSKFSDKILFLETSEELPSHEFVRRFMISLGEAKVLGSVKALILGRAKSWYFGNTLSLQERIDYNKTQTEIVLSVFRDYNSHAPVVTNVNIGHTDPQVVVPYGGRAKIDCENKKISFSFS